MEGGHRVVVLSRRPDQARRDLPFPAEVFAWEEAGEPPPSALENIEAVVHLAGEPVAGGRWTAARKARIRDSRVLGTDLLVKSIARSPSARRSLKTFVMSSAVGFYGDRGDDPVDESSAPGEGFLAEVCVAWEEAGFALAREPGFEGVRIAAVRTGVVLAREGGALPKLLPTFARGMGGKVGSGQQWMSWIHLDDIVGLYLFALESGSGPLSSVSGPLNGVSPHPSRNEGFSLALAKAVGKSLLLPLPEAVVRAALGEMSTVLLTGAKASARKAEGLGYVFRFPDLAPALADLCAPERDGDRQLTSEQWVPRPVDDVFRFFSDAGNLEALTPPFLSFSMDATKNNEASLPMREGTLIDYRLSVHGVPLRWQSRIEEWVPGRRFVDEQTKGPYAKWRHTHEFKALGGGTLLSDRVRYRLPLGGLGSALAGWKVDADVQAIFDFRRQKISELFA